MDQFICLRMIQMNGVDLRQFQFDFDMSFAVIFMNPDGTIYGRYGTRNSKPDGAENHISLQGLREALHGALALHSKYPENAASLAAKKGSPPRFDRPELYPKLNEYKAEITYENQVARSCIHCHQVHAAQRLVFRRAKQNIPDEKLYLYPMPQSVGLTLDPKKRATVFKVEASSAAEQAGLQSRDEILFAGGQPLLSMADFQWVLHQAPAKGAKIDLQIRRAGQTIDLDLSLGDGWRKKADFTWRTSTWDLRRLVLGGMVLVPGDHRGLGLVVKHAGKYGEHATARRAGIRPDDQLISIGEKSERSSEGEVIAHLLNAAKSGDRIQVKALRNGAEREFSYLAR